MKGRKPKPEGQRVNRVKPVHEWTQVENTPYTGERPSPTFTYKATDRWWETVSSMPHCVLWADSDWEFALETGLLVDNLNGGKISLAAEVRQRSNMLGLTLAARRDLRIRYVDSAKDEEWPKSRSESSTEPASVTAMAKYRSKVTPTG